jgi:hypothetical protein
MTWKPLCVPVPWWKSSSKASRKAAQPVHAADAALAAEVGAPVGYTREVICSSSERRCC